MKKTYVAPVMEREMFETSDVITASVFTFNNEGKNAAAGNVPTVDVNEAFN